MTQNRVHAIHVKAPRRERGALLVQAVVTLLVCVIALTGMELGYLFFVKREMQKAADLAALSGARTLATTNCTAANAAATTNAAQNLTSLNFTVTTVPTCGRWDPAGSAGNNYFTSGGTPANAVNVVVSGTGPTFLPFLKSRLVAAQALAKSGPPLAGFSVGTKLAVVTGNGVLGDSLKMLGLDLTGTSLVGYDGLVNAKITPKGLLDQLGIPVAGDLTVGGLNSLLQANHVSIGQLLDATARAAGHTELLSTNATLVNAITARLATGESPNQVKLGSDASGTNRGLFANVVTPDTTASSALNAQVSALDIVSSAIGVATAGHALDVASLNLNLLGLANVTTKVGVVEPPSIAFGTVGVTAYTAQVRTYIHLQTTNALLGSLLSPLVKLDLPIVVDVVSGKGTLAELCTPALKDASGNERARITVESAIAQTCVGNMAAADIFSKSKVCDENLSNMQLLNVAGVLQANNKINIAALPSNGSVTLKEGETKSVDNNLQIGTTVANIVNALSAQLFGGTPPPGTPSSTPVDQANNLATKLFNDSSSVCSADTTACRQLRINAVRNAIANDTAASGLLSGVVGGLNNILNALNLLGGNGCTAGTGLLGAGPTTNAACIALIKGDLNNASNAAGGGTVNNSVSTLTGIVKPLLNSLGSTVLTPLLQNVLGIRLGVTDVNLIKLNCNGEARLVY